MGLILFLGAFKSVNLSIFFIITPYGKKIYSWTHIIMNIKRCKEWEVSLYMWIIEIGFVALAFGLKAMALL